MKIISVLLFMVFLCCKIYSQSVNQFEVYFTPTGSYRLLKDKTGYDERMAPRFDAGIAYRKIFMNKVAVGTGLDFSKMGYNGSYYYAYSDDIIDYRYNRYFLELPLLFSYGFVKKGKDNLILDLGLVNQFLFHTKLNIRQNKFRNFEEVMTYKELRDQKQDVYNFAVQAGITYQRNLTEKWTLRFTPAFKFSVLSMNNIHDWTVGLKLGVGYKK
jgi:hypothetical protein